MAEGKQNLQNAAIIAKLFGVTDRRIQQLAKEGIIPAAQKRPYMFDLLPTVQSYIRYLSDKANGREAKNADTAQVEMEKLRAEADMKRSKADMTAIHRAGRNCKAVYPAGHDRGRRSGCWPYCLRRDHSGGADRRRVPYLHRRERAEIYQRRCSQHPRAHSQLCAAAYA